MIFTFLQDQVLSMKWLNALIGRTLGALGLDTATRAGGSIQFFLYDVIKITFLLCFLIFLISYIQSYFPPERSKKIMARFHGLGANCIAALLGTVTPFCSCSSIPLFIGFTSAGLPLGVTFSFLISSPMVDLGSLILLMSIFGAKVAVSYVVIGLLVAVVGGTVIERLHMENEVEDFIRSASAVELDSPALTQALELVNSTEIQQKLTAETGYARRLAPTQEGDVLLVATTGAYGRVMSSSYNLREPAAERLLEPAPEGLNPAPSAR